MKRTVKALDIVVAAICETQFLDPSEVAPTARLVDDLECNVQDLVEIQYLVEKRLDNEDLFDDIDEDKLTAMTVQDLAHWIAKQARRAKPPEPEPEANAEPEKSEET